MAKGGCGYNNGRAHRGPQGYWNWVWIDCKSGNTKSHRMGSGQHGRATTPTVGVGSVKMNTGMGRSVSVPAQSRTGRMLQAGIIRGTRKRRR